MPSMEPASDDVREIATSMLELAPKGLRQLISPEALNNLVNSVKEQGIIEPILVTPVGENRYHIIAGERRWRAARILGLPRVPAIIREATPQHALELAITSNVQRETMDAIDIAHACLRLIDDFDLGINQAALRLGVSVPWLRRTLSLLELSEVLQEALRNDVITRDDAILIGSLRRLVETPAKFDEIISEWLRVRQAIK